MVLTIVTFFIILLGLFPQMGVTCLLLCLSHPVLIGIAKDIRGGGVITMSMSLGMLSFCDWDVVTGETVSLLF